MANEQALKEALLKAREAIQAAISAITDGNNPPPEPTDITPADSVRNARVARAGVNAGCDEGCAGCG